MSEFFQELRTEIGKYREYIAECDKLYREAQDDIKKIQTLVEAKRDKILKKREAQEKRVKGLESSYEKYNKPLDKAINKRDSLEPKQQTLTKQKNELEAQISKLIDEKIAVLKKTSWIHSEKVNVDTSKYDEQIEAQEKKFDDICRRLLAIEKEMAATQQIIQQISNNEAFLRIQDELIEIDEEHLEEPEEDLEIKISDSYSHFFALVGKLKETVFSIRFPNFYGLMTALGLSTEKYPTMIKIPDTYSIVYREQLEQVNKYAKMMSSMEARKKYYDEYALPVFIDPFNNKCFVMETEESTNEYCIIRTEVLDKIEANITQEETLPRYIKRIGLELHCPFISASVLPYDELIRLSELTPEQILIEEQRYYREKESEQREEEYQQQLALQRKELELAERTHREQMEQNERFQREQAAYARQQAESMQEQARLAQQAADQARQQQYQAEWEEKYRKKQQELSDFREREQKNTQHNEAMRRCRACANFSTCNMRFRSDTPCASFIPK